jgi:hypothetical protein
LQFRGTLSIYELLIECNSIGSEASFRLVARNLIQMLQFNAINPPFNAFTAHLMNVQWVFILPTAFEWTHNPQRKNQENTTTAEDEVEEKSFSIRSSGNHANRNQQKEHCSACHQSKNICFIEAFLQDFYSIMFFSYRKEFPPLEATELTTDIGWGCMLRTGTYPLSSSIHTPPWTIHIIFFTWNTLRHVFFR